MLNWLSQNSTFILVLLMSFIVSSGGVYTITTRYTTRLLDTEKLIEKNKERHMSMDNPRYKRMVRNAIDRRMLFDFEDIVASASTCHICNQNMYTLSTGNVALYVKCDCGVQMDFGRHNPNIMRQQNILAECIDEYRDGLIAFRSQPRKKLEKPVMPNEILSLTELHTYLNNKKGYGHQHAFTAINQTVGLMRKRLQLEIAELEEYAKGMQRGRRVEGVVIPVTEEDKVTASYYRTLAKMLGDTLRTLPE